MTKPAANPALLLPPSADLPAWAARRLLERHHADIPDLSRVTVLLPALAEARDLRARLTRLAGRGLLGPHVHLLSSFANTRAADAPSLSPLDCRLLLTEALNRHRNLFPGQNSAQVAEALFALFEELTASEVTIAEDEAAFSRVLQQAYRAKPLPWLSFEAQIIHRLWQAFQTDSGGRSPAMAYARRLPRAFQSLRADERVYLIGFDEFNTVECAAVGAALRAGTAELWLHGRREGRDGAALASLCQRLDIQPEAIEGPDNARRHLLDAAFADATTPVPGQRPARAEIPLTLVEASGPEHEARCVELAVRQALLDGDRNVVVLAQDRRLARRLRALLERAGVPLQDHVGWALSTSQAAATLNAWLECLDTRFHFRPLLELLKSGFLEADAAALQTLEHELVYRQGIEHGLDRFLSAAKTHPVLSSLLQQVKTAARAGLLSNSPQAAQRRTEALIQSLRDLGIWPRLQADDAGRKLIALLEQLQSAFRRSSLVLGGTEFRALLDRAIERETFVPETAASPVRLLTLEQSHNLRCDTLILAGASREQLPGAPAAEPFFNQSVRGELGLPGWPQRQSLALARLRRVLESASRVWITYAPESAGDAAQLSTWLEALESQAVTAGLNLRDSVLAQRAGTAAVEIMEGSASAEAPAGPTLRPAPPAPNDLLPAELSASAHQTLLDCPYRFFAHSLLRLRAEQAPDEDPDRSDYGRHVHRILQAFTEPVSGLPPPFGAAINAANRGQAQVRLEELAQAVFAPELETRALALSWLAEFRAAIPVLLDWMAQRGPLGRVNAEAHLEKVVGRFRWIGTADRLEIRPDGSQVVVDFKTGKPPRRSDVETGEAVQLLHYAALDPRIVAVEYFPLKEGEKPLAFGQGLAELRDRVDRRLSVDMERLSAGAALPAHGDDDTCEHCDYSGLCRKKDWRDD